MACPVDSTRRLAAIVFADIVGYTSLSAENEPGALALVARLQSLSSEAVESRGGRVVKYLGDAVLAEFASAGAAVEASLALSRRFAEAEPPDVEGVLRVGAHLGETTFAADGDVYGDVVNVAARLQAAAEPGQVLVSEAVWQQLRRRPTLAFEDAGTKELKGVAGPVRAYSASHRIPVGRPHDARIADGVDASSRKHLAVVPFQVLRTDPDLGFLSFGLADAVACSLLGVRSLVVRSPASLQRFAGTPVDPRQVADAASVDLVLAGTILKAGDRVRVSAQLMDGERGTLLWNETTTVAFGDLFELQDDLARRIVDSVAVPLDVRDRDRVARDVSHSGPGYELYLRASQASIQERDWATGAELYRAALDADPAFAPAWARLGRCYRLLGKYAESVETMEDNASRAERAFQRALELNPDLPLGHSLLAQFEVEAGRCVDGIGRLLARASEHGAAVDDFVGLTHALRYGGLLDASLAAHARAAELDPGVVTSVPFTHLLSGEYERAVEIGGATSFSSAHAYVFNGCREEALRCLAVIGGSGSGTAIDRYAAALSAAARRDPDAAERLGRQATRHFPDPEGVYFMGTHLLDLGKLDAGMELLHQAVAGGFYCAQGLQRDPRLEPLRDRVEFGAALELAEAGHQAALAAFQAGGGPDLLGLEATV